MFYLIMKSLGSLIIALLFSVHVLAQLNCKSTGNANGEKIKTCYHANNIISTRETWDKDNRFGKFVGYNNQGKEIFNYSLRNFGGHSSVSVNYYDNGQVSKVYHSDAPDGGIQFYNSTISFDKQGKMTGFDETKNPDILTLPSTVKPQVQLSPNDSAIAKPESIEMKCASLKIDYFEIQNGSTSKLKVIINSVPNINYPKKSFSLTLKPSQKVRFDSILSAQSHLSKALYKPEVISIGKKQKKKKYKLVATTEENKTLNTKTWYWVIVND